MPRFWIDRYTLRARKLAAVLGMAGLLMSCVTARKDSSPAVRVDYSSEESVSSEMDNAAKALDKDPVEALARFWVLKENVPSASGIDSLLRQAQDKSLQAFDAALSAEQWGDALRIFRSLDALSLAPKDWNLSILESRIRDAWKRQGNVALAALDASGETDPSDAPPSPKTVATLMSGTVTVWVDRGLRVQNGVGYADRVIGSGFFIDPRGYFVTNYHVISSEVDPAYEGYSRLFIKLQNGPDARIPAKVIGWDPVLDLALAKTEVTPPAIFSLGSSLDLAVGTRIYAMGSPAGLDQTLTSGIVSAKNRRFISLGEVLQIDAPINHGNSGGPIVDETGLVQAVVFAGIETYEGLNFAVPVEYLKKILPSLYAGGEVTHPWLGASGRSVPLSGSRENGGVELVYGLPGGPAILAGLDPGTVITAVNGIPVSSLEELQALMLAESPGTIVRITGIPADGNGEAGPSRDWFVYLAPRPRNPGQAILDRDLEFRAMLPIFGLDLERVGKTSRYTVRSVTRGGIGDESGFSSLDVVEIRDVEVDPESSTVAVQLYTKRRKSGYLDAFIGLGASLDSPSYF